MNRVVLFSGVGGTDPMHESNKQDGSMLHICRYYHPNEIYLYVTAQMQDLKRDELCKKYIFKLYEQKQLEAPRINCFLADDNVKVEEFDEFYQIFFRHIKNITSDFDDTDTLLINISSGTPAMKSALLILVAIGAVTAKVIQVKTPVGGINQHIHTPDADFEKIWADNPDNLKVDNRCKEIDYKGFIELEQEAQIKNEIMQYDYVVAYSMASSLPGYLTDAYLDLLALAADRYQLKNMESVIERLDKIGISVFSNPKQSDHLIFEYALNLQSKVKHKEYADFLRAVTPLIADLFELILLQMGIDINRLTYCDKNNIRKWDLNKIRESGLLEEFDKLYPDKFKEGPVLSDPLAKLIAKKTSDKKLKKLVGKIRNIESQVRNLAAHEIVSVTEDEIYRRTHYHVEDIMQMIRECFSYSGLEVSEDSWSAYDRMNEYIIGKM